MFLLRRSMLAQMTLLTIVFLGWGVYAFVVRPVLEIPLAEPRRPIEATAASVQEAIQSFMIDQRDDPSRVRPLATNPAIRAAQAENPDFRYYVRVGDRTFGNGRALYFRALHLDRAERLWREMPDLGLCVYSSKPLSLDNAAGFSYLYMCDSLTYFEYRGLVHPVVANNDSLTPVYQKWLLAFGNTFLIAALGMFGIFALIMLGHMLLIRRVAKLAASIDPEKLDRKLPEKGLATEILPLVRAVNHMLVRVQESQRRNRFFLSAAAHEMRTPLTVLRTRMELMDEGVLKEKLTRDARRLVTLVNQLLALMSIANRSEAAGFVDLVACCRKAVAEEQAAGGVTIAFASVVEGLEIAGEDALIRSAVGNLIRNAVSFSPPGGRVEVMLDGGGMVSVRDHGPGLTGDDPSMMFEPFVRFPPNRDGHGLGLAIVKAIATLHGGRATAANAEGGGAVFRIWFDPTA